MWTVIDLISRLRILLKWLAEFVGIANKKLPKTLSADNGPSKIRISMDNGEKWRKPVDAKWPIGTPFGEKGPRWKDGHKGDDFECPKETEVRASKTGSVGWAGDAGDGFGNYIRLEHPDGTRSYYCHLGKILVAIGETVMVGQVIGYSGNSGNVSGFHLHFEVRKDGVSFKPEYVVS